MSATATPDLLATFARTPPPARGLIASLDETLTSTQRELNMLADLAEQLQHEAGAVIARAQRGQSLGARDLVQLSKLLDALMAWQIAETRTRGVAKRAYVHAQLHEAGFR